MKLFNGTLSKKMITIDIGTYQVKVVEGSFNNNTIKVYKAFSISTPKGSYEDGKILSIGRLAQGIKEGLEQNGIKTKSAIFTIKSSHIIYREFLLPQSKPKILEQMVEMETQQNLPVDINHYQVDYKVLESLRQDGELKYRVLAAAVPKELVQGYMNLFSLLHLKEIAIDLQSNSISKLMNHCRRINNQVYVRDHTIALIDLGYQSTELTVLEWGIGKFNRTLPIGSRELDIHSPNREQSFLLLLEEINKNFLYYTSRSSSNRINEIYFYGGMASFDPLLSYFKEKISSKVSYIQSMDHVQYEKIDKQIELKDYLNAIGALIRQ